MVRVGISVEGETEQRFVQMVLSPYLLPKKILLQPISAGGNISVDKARSELQKIANSFDYVTTLYDFYGFKGKASGETKGSLESRLVGAVHGSVQAKLIPYIQMYEFEGLLFSSPEWMAVGLNEESAKVWADRVLFSAQGDPEKINNSPQTAPSKRLEMQTGYNKVVHGPNIADLIGIEHIRKMCKGFDAWLSQIEALSCGY